MRAAAKMLVGGAIAIAGLVPMASPSSAQGACDPNYTGCVPVAEDVDCAGGEGDGPAYAEGPVEVIGDDVYELDSDGDGYACEPEGWTPPPTETVPPNTAPAPEPPPTTTPATPEAPPAAPVVEEPDYTG